MDLTPHPQFSPRLVERVTVQILGVTRDTLEVEWWVYRASELVRPTEAAPARVDALWQTTCFEAFLKPEGGDAYLEFNFSPSFQWAAYEFDRYREGSRARQMRCDPKIAQTIGLGEHFHLSAEFEVNLSLAPPTFANFTAVIEEIEGQKSYWALAHPADGPPDFHDPACFVLELPPPEAT